MRDHLPPDEASLREAATFLQQSVGNGKVVLVHCLAGEGRTGCALAAYLVMGKRVAAKEAMDDLRRVKPQFIEKGQEPALFRLENAAAGISNG